MTARPAQGHLIRVLQIPGNHPYVLQCSPVGSGTVQIPPDLPGEQHPALRLEWIREHAHEYDVVHLHFGFDQLTEHELGLWVMELECQDVPLVYTVHDLRNPHHGDPAQHDAHLDVLVPSADAVVTLTDGAAARIRRRWGRDPLVVPHPQIYGPQVRPARPAGPARAGIHLKSLRRNIVDPFHVVAAAARGARAAGGVLQVDLHPGMLGLPALQGLSALAADGWVELRVHERFTEQQLADYLTSLDVSILPNQFGTHSGWLEACRDVGTRVVSPSCGFYAEQWHEVVGYTNDETAGLDRASLEHAVATALMLPPVGVASPELRQQQAAVMRAEHARLYARLAHDSRSAA